jgi:hypothetical protein
MNATNGNVLWQLPVSSSSDPQYGNLCPNSETLFAVWAPTDFYTRTPQNITAFDARTGAQLWTTVSLGGMYEMMTCSSSAIETKEAPKGVFFGNFTDNSYGAIGLFGLRADTGALLWFNDTFYNNLIGCDAQVCGMAGAFIHPGTRPIWVGAGAGTRVLPMNIDGVTGELIYRSTPFAQSFVQPVGNSSGSETGQPPTKVFVTNGQRFGVFEMLINATCRRMNNEAICKSSSHFGCQWCASQGSCYQIMEESCINNETECGSVNPNLPTWPWPGSPSLPLPSPQCTTIENYCQGCGVSCVSVAAGVCCDGVICGPDQQSRISCCADGVGCC